MLLAGPLRDSCQGGAWSPVIMDPCAWAGCPPPRRGSRPASSCLVSGEARAATAPALGTRVLVLGGWQEGPGPDLPTTSAAGRTPGQRPRPASSASPERTSPGLCWSRALVSVGSTAGWPAPSAQGTLQDLVPSWESEVGAAGLSRGAMGWSRPELGRAEPWLVPTVRSGPTSYSKCQCPCVLVTGWAWSSNLQEYQHRSRVKKTFQIPKSGECRAQGSRPEQSLDSGLGFPSLDTAQLASVPWCLQGGVSAPAWPLGQCVLHHLL